MNEAIKGETMPKLYIFIMYCNERGCIVAVADNEENARKTMENEWNYDKDRPLSRHEIVAGFVFSHLGDM